MAHQARVRVWRIGDGYTVVSTTGGATDNVVVSGDYRLDFAPPYRIALVSTGSKKFTILGNFAERFTAGTTFTISGSTGNDRTYTVVTGTNVGPTTEIVVSETVASSTADGWILRTGELPLQIYLLTGDADAGWKTISGANPVLSSGNTVAYITDNITGGGSSGTVYLPDWYDFEFGARWLPIRNKPGQRIADRLGLMHRIMPVAAANKQRHPIGATLTVPSGEVQRQSHFARHLLEFCEDFMLDADDPLIIFVQYTGTDCEGDEWSKYRAFRAYLEDIPPYLESTYIGVDGDAPKDLEFQFFIYAHGGFVDWDNPFSQVTWVTRP